MMLSRLGRSISSRSRMVPQNVLSGRNGGRSQILTDYSVYQSRADDNLGVLKRYLGSLAAKNAKYGSRRSSKVYISDINSILANPRIRRFFSREVPKKEDDGNFYSKEKKETPQGNNQKSESKEESSTKDDERLLKFFFCLLVIVLLFPHYPKKNEIYFYEFEHDFLRRGLVDLIVIVNKSVAEVYVKNLQSTDGINSREKYHIKIRHFESFEEQLKRAQESLGKNSRVPVWYTFK